MSSWFRVAQGTVTGSGYSSIPDVLNVGNPAVQSTDALRPLAATSSNGLPILNCSTHVMTVPLIAANNGTTAWGFWAWLRINSTAANPDPCSIRQFSGASLNKVDIQRIFNGADAFVLFNTTSTSHGAQPPLWTLNTWGFFTFEFDGTGATNADRMVITKDGAQVSPLTFQNFNGTPGTVTTALLAPTGTACLCGQQTNGSNPWLGNFGPNFGFLNSKMSGSTGLLTSAARTSLMNFERPT